MKIDFSASNIFALGGLICCLISLATPSRSYWGYAMAALMFFLAWITLKITGE